MIRGPNVGHDELTDVRMLIGSERRDFGGNEVRNSHVVETKIPYGMSIGVVSSNVVKIFYLHVYLLLQHCSNSLTMKDL